MIFVAGAGDRKFIHLQQTYIARRDCWVIQNSSASNPVLKKILHYARDHVPLCSSLQIQFNPVFLMLSGLIIRRINDSGGTHGILCYDYYCTTALG